MTGSDFLGLDPTAAPPRSRTAWLAQQLRSAIADGTLPPGTRLPASRAMANDLAFARGTVVEAYRRLAEEGLVVTNHGGGTEVAELASASGRRPTPGPNRVAPRPTLDISEGAPDLKAFPRAAWLRTERNVLARVASRQLGYGDPQGAPELRSALAGWLTRSRGVVAEPEQIIVTAGVTGALSLLAQVLREQGITECAVEDPGAEGNRRILDFWLDKLHPVPVDDQGLDATALARTKTRAVLVTPAHQFPTGVVLSPARRRALVAWADGLDAFVIEDDYDAEYRYDRVSVRALQAAAPERVVHVSSLSKVLAPGLRIGWMIAPAVLHHELIRRRWATDLGSPVVPQLVLAELIQTGALERQLRSLRLKHRQRRDAAVAAIERYLPGCRMTGIAAGLHLLVQLPDGVDDATLAARAKAAGIAVQPLSALRHRPGAPGLVVGYGPHPSPRLEQALRTIGALAGFIP